MARGNTLQRVLAATALVAVAALLDFSLLRHRFDDHAVQTGGGGIQPRLIT